MVTETFTIRNNNGGGGGTNQTLTITLTGVNDAPVLVSSSTLNYTENGAATVVNSGITLSDIDSTTFSSATVSITSNFQSGADILAFTNNNSTNFGNISASYNATTGVLTLTSANGTATTAQFQNALRAVTYSNSSDNPSTAARTISFQVNDGGATNNLSNIVTSTVNVTAVNDAPTLAIVTPGSLTDTAANDSFSNITGTLAGSDPDSSTLTYGITGGTVSGNTSTLAGSYGTLTLNTTTGTYTYTPNATAINALSSNTSDNFTFTVSDGSLSATRAFTVNITGTNDAPIGSPTAVLSSGTEDTTYLISAASLLQGFSDAEGNTLSVNNLTATNGTLVNNGNGTYSFTPNANFNGTVNLSYNVIDGQGGSTTATRSFSVAAANDPVTGSPTATLVAGTEDQSYTVTATQLLQGFSDVDIATNGQSLSVTNLTTSNGTVTNNGNGTYTITPTTNFNGTVTLTYSLTDSNGSTLTGQTRTYSVAPVNDAPTGTATASLAAGTEDTTYTITAASLLQGFSDVDGDTLSVSGLTATNGTLVNNGNGTYTFTPAANFNGTVNLSYNVIDGQGGSTAATQSFSVAAVNDPVTGSPSATLVAGTEDTAYTVTTVQLLQGFTDVDIATNAQSLSVNNGDGTYTITPSADFNGSVTLTYDVSDGNGSTLTGQTRSYSLAPVNDPVTGSPSATLADGSEDSSYTVSATQLLQGFSDGDADALSIANLTASNGTVVNNGDGTYTITPSADFNGSVTLTYDVSDGNGSTLTGQTRSYSLAPVNDAPTNISLNASSVDENAAGAEIGNLTVTDPDAGDTHTFSVDDNRFEVVNGQLKLKDGVFLDYEALNNGQLPITVTATDAGGLSYAKDFTISVNDVNEVPIDTTPPDAPTIAQVAGDDRVNSTEKTAGVTISGTAEANSTVNVTWGGTVLTTTAGANGSWSQNFTSAQIPTDGTTTISATATDAAGNTSTAGTRSVLIDTIVAAPTVTLLNDTGTSTSDGITKDASRNVSGEQGATLEYRIGNGNWSSTYTAPTTDGSYTVQVRQTDLAGNVSSSGSISFTLDKTAPTAPTIAQVAGDDIVNSAEKTAGVTVSGIAEANSTLNITWGSTTLTATADASGNWSRAFSSAQIPTDGNTKITATARDAAGNTSTAVTRSVLIDTVAPNAPTITNVTDDVGSIQGSIAAGGSTDDSTPTLVIGLANTTQLPVIP